MGELLRFPPRRSEGEQEEAAGRVPAPSSDSDEPVQWAVPVVGASERTLEPERADRADRAARRASNVAMATLARHDASEGEVRARLVAKGLEEAEVEAELERLRSVGLLDDVTFAERLVASLRERKGLGDGAIRTALRGRLVPPAVVDQVLAEHVEDEDELHDRLQSVADDRAKRLTTLPAEVAERRLIAYLMRKGYSGSAVRAAARAALDAASRR